MADHQKHPPGNDEIERLYGAHPVAEALKNPEVLRRLSDLSADPLGLSPAETAAFMKLETERWGAVVRSAGVKVE